MDTSVDINFFIEEIPKGNKQALSRAITLVESTKAEHNEIALKIISELEKKKTPKNTLRIGITGIPGVGKSTLINRLGLHLAQKNSIATLCIDPSSQDSKGSILGDKTRMEDLSRQANAYIRPSAAGSTLGGVGLKTRETIMLCEQAGYQNVLVETVGVGQNEVAVASMVDVLLLLVIPGAGDELQGIKRGIMEVADIIVVNKAYSNNELSIKAKQSIGELNNALHYFPISDNAQSTKVVAVDSLENININSLYLAISQIINHQKKQGKFETRRNEQQLYWFHDTIKYAVYKKYLNTPRMIKNLKKIEQQVLKGELNSFSAANLVINKLP